MSCDICGSANCCVSFHSFEEQEQYREVIEAFEHARELREKIRSDREDLREETTSCQD